jgi:hypothetical protein
MAVWLVIFVTRSLMTEGQTMTNLQADAMSRAAQIAVREIKSKIRDEKAHQRLRDQ